LAFNQKDCAVKIPFERMTIYSGPLSMFGAKVQIAAQEKDLDFHLVMVAYDSVSGYMPKHTEVLRINPKGQVPVLTHGELEIFDSTQIFEYLEDLQPNPPLWPRDLTTRARARRLEHQSDEIYFPHIIRLMAGAHDSAACRPSGHRRDGDVAQSGWATCIGIYGSSVNPELLAIGGRQLPLTCL
jgi:glutathione S-transferase